jgi:hypothetical protein
MRFSSFISFLRKLTFHRSKNQLKSLPFVPAFSFSAFRLKKPAEKQEQTGPKAFDEVFLFLHMHIEAARGAVDTDWIKY